MSVEDFKKGLDYRDICYMVDHVKNTDARLDVLKTLGYDIGVNIVFNDAELKSVFKGKKGEFRVIVAPKEQYFNLAKCAIVM